MLFQLVEVAGMKRPSGEHRREIGEVLLRGPQVVDPRAGEAALRGTRGAEAQANQSGSTEGLDEDGWVHTGNMPIPALVLFKRN